MSDASQREWRFYLDDRIDFAGKVPACTDGLVRAGVVAAGLTDDAALRNLESRFGGGFLMTSGSL